MGVGYIPRAGLIYVIALTNTFQQVLTSDQTNAIRGMKMHIRFTKNQAPPFFQMAFSATPTEGAISSGTGIYTLSGNGSGDMSAPSSGLFVRLRDSGTVGTLEILTWG